MPAKSRPFFTSDDVRPSKGELADIKREAREVCGADWLITPNTRFGGRSPLEVIDSNQAFWVRDVVRSIKHGDFS
jgi:uncharacterized protein (DUF2384 family)